MGGHFASAEVGGVGACVRGLKVASSLRSGVEVCNAGCAVDTVAGSSGEGAFDPKPSYSNGSADVEEAKANWEGCACEFCEPDPEAFAPVGKVSLHAFPAEPPYPSIFCIMY